MEPAGTHPAYLRVFGATFLLACIGGAAINYLVDPYALFGTRRIAGFNELKPAAPDRVRVIKPYMAARAAARVVIGGNSRPEMGLDPQSECWAATERPVFNAGVPGADVFMQTRYAQHAVESGHARRVLFGVDFLDFMVDASRPTGAIDWDRLGERFDGRLRTSAAQGAAVSLRQGVDVLGGLFSLVALGDSFRTVATQGERAVATRRDDGFNPGMDYLPIIRAEGQSVLFTQKNRELSGRLGHAHLGVLDVNGLPTVSLEALRRFLAWARARDLEVVLFINPYHSDYLVQIQMAGRWPLLEAWKRELTAVAGEYGVPLWDFNGFDPHSTEDPPRPGDKRSVLRWFWEPAHYRRELGDRMLASMFGRPCGPGGFGSRITEASLQGHLDRLRADMRRFIDENPEVVARLRGPR